MQTVEREVLVAGEALLTVVLAASGGESFLQLVTVQYLVIRAATAEMVALGEIGGDAGGGRGRPFGGKRRERRKCRQWRQWRSGKRW